MVVRRGDPVGAVAAFVSTAGIGGARGAVVPTSLAAIFEAAGARLNVRATPQADGVRVVVRTTDARDVARLAEVLQETVTSATDLTIVKRKLAALGALPSVPDVALVAACEGVLVPPANLSTPTQDELEGWRRAAVVTSRVGFGVVGDAAVEHAPALPTSSDAPYAPEDSPALVTYADAANVSAIDVVWRGDVRLLGVARTVGAPHSPFMAMVAADSGASVRAVTATLSARGACLSMHALLDADAAREGADRAAALIALATRHVRAAALDSTDASISPDALDAAEQAALIALASTHEARLEEPLVVASSRSGASSEALAHALVAATHAWDSRVLDVRAAVERGQPEAWMLIASPCGTAGETDGDAGASAAFAIAVARAVRDRGVAAQPWIASDGVGVLASDRDIRKLADTLARSFIVDPVEGARAAQGQLLDGVHPALAALAQAIASGRPASVLPMGTAYALLRLSDAAIVARAEALRRGPLRIAVISNDSQGEAAATRADQWVAREGSRTCPAQATAQTPKPGTYAVVTEDGSSEAYIAAMVPEGADADAALIAEALDGTGGLLDKAVGDGLARAFGARVLGAAGTRAIVVHLEAPSSALDVAVAQTRALLDRLRQGALGEGDLARARKRMEQARATRLGDPRERLIALFRGDVALSDPPSLDKVRATASAVLHDEQLVIIAARPSAHRAQTSGRQAP